MENTTKKPTTPKEELYEIKIDPRLAKGEAEVIVCINDNKTFVPVGQNVKVTKAVKKILERAEYI